MYRVMLQSCGNIDYGENPKKPKSPFRIFAADSIEGCSQAVIDYIEEFNLDSGNWCGGQIYDRDNDYVGRISYNGKFWHKNHIYGKEN